MDELRKQALARAKGNRADSRLALGIGTELHEYTIEWVLGVGGFGITYLALDGNLETEVALKEYIPSDMVMRNPDGSLSPKDAENASAFKTGLDKFLLECRTLANFKHNNVHHNGSQLCSNICLWCLAAGNTEAPLGTDRRPHTNRI